VVRPTGSDLVIFHDPLDDALVPMRQGRSELPGIPVGRIVVPHHLRHDRLRSRGWRGTAIAAIFPHPHRLGFRRQILLSPLGDHLRPGEDLWDLLMGKQMDQHHRREKQPEQDRPPGHRRIPSIPPAR
jgi:hypothetical protein